MDGPSVNLKFYDKLVKFRQECELPQLINIGICGLHVNHGALKTGIEKTEWDIKKTMKGSFHVLHDTPARRSDYSSVTGSDVFPLFFCALRWVEDKPVADRLINGSHTNNIAKKRGTVVVDIQDEYGIIRKATLNNALYIPSYPQNIFSVQAATEKGAKVNFNADSGELVNKDGVKFPIQKHGRLYYLCKTSTDNIRS